MEYDLLAITNKFMEEGFFSEYLPSYFNLKSPNINIFDEITLSTSSDFIKPYKFTMNGINNTQRRMVDIPEFSVYLSAVKFMRDNNIIEELIKISNNNATSYSPILQPNGELTNYDNPYNIENEQCFLIDNDFTSDLEESPTFIQNTMNKINQAKGAKGILCIDISNFYGSIYTHLIPCIPLGYDEAHTQFELFKENQQHPLISPEYKKYRKLDERVRSLNSNQTNGLLVGPLISRFLAEALLCCIDNEILNQNINFVRFVDDYEIFIYNENDKDTTKNTIISILDKYSFTINNEKTKYLPFPYYITENLEKMIAKYIPTSNPINSKDLYQLFNTFLQLENNGIKGAIKYLIKSINSNIQINDKDLFKSYLLNILVNDNRSFQKVCALIIREQENLLFDEHDISIIKNLLQQHILNKKHLETIWLLFMLKRLGINSLEDNLIIQILNSANELAIIILLEDYSICLTENMLNICISNAKSWILLYQLYLRNYITDNIFKQKTKINHNVAIYKKLKYNNFSFYKK